MKKLSLILIGMLFLNNGICFSQSEDDRINFYDGEFFLIEEDYPEALSAFTKVYNSNYQDNANINYLMGVCYLKINGEKDKALPHLKKSILNISENYKEGNFKEDKAPIESYLLLAKAYLIIEDFDNSCKYYTQYQTYLKDNQINEINFTQQQISNCERARKKTKEAISLKMESIGSLYNSRLNNFNPVISGNGLRFAYMSQQKFYDAIYYVEINNGKWSNPINITPQIQSDGDQYVTSLSYDGKQMFLSRIDVDDADIMISEYESGRWSKSKNIGKPVNSKYFESHACISPDGKTLYFASNRKESLGGMDIYRSHLLENGKEWSEPENLGDIINTKLNEDSPVLSADGKKLYFSSQGHDNIGGYDVFYSSMNQDGSWTKPLALPYPLNTTDDDLLYTPANNGNSAYLSKNEKSGMGGTDIYYVSDITGEIADTDLSDVKLSLEDKKEGEEKILSEEIKKETTSKEEITEEIPQQTQIEVAKEIVEVSKQYFTIKPIFFKFDSYHLSDIAKNKLKVIQKALDIYPNLKLEIEAHTDAMGPETYNLYLSEKRAKSVKAYLTEIGVSENNLSIKAFSENQPIALNETSDGKDCIKGRQLNRRVEFKVLNEISDIIILEEVKVPNELKYK